MFWLLEMPIVWDQLIGHRPYAHAGSQQKLSPQCCTPGPPLPWRSVCIPACIWPTDAYGPVSQDVWRHLLLWQEGEKNLESRLTKEVSRHCVSLPSCPSIKLDPYMVLFLHIYCLEKHTPATRKFLPGKNRASSAELWSHKNKNLVIGNKPQTLSGLLSGWQMQLSGSLNLGDLWHLQTQLLSVEHWEATSLVCHVILCKSAARQVFLRDHLL